jgi:hypothetical protein
VRRRERGLRSRCSAALLTRLRSPHDKGKVQLHTKGLVSC